MGAKDVAVRRIDPTTRATGELRVPIDELVVGDHFVVRPGEKIATDGVVVDGRSSVDRSLVTGESMPVGTGPGDEVTGGTLNVQGRLVVEARRVGAETTLAAVTRLVERAQQGKAPVQRLADRVSGVFVPVVLGLALLTFLRVAADRARRHDVVVTGGRRADHRLPLRPGAGHARPPCWPAPAAAPSSAC